MTADLTVADISRMLAAQINQLVRELLPGGHHEGRHEWRCGSVNGDKGHSLGVHLNGKKAGVWQDFANGDGGDALDLVKAVCGFETGEAITWSKRWLEMDDGKVVKPRQAPAAKPCDDGTDAKAKHERALEIWRDAVTDIASTQAEVYMRGRGFDPAQQYSIHGGLARWPATLRYSEHAAFDPAFECRAMLVAVHGAGIGLVRAIQRILLDVDGTAVRDNRGRRKKLSLGPIRGNAAMFDYWPDPQGRWGLAEGPENALAAYALTGIPTWAAISAGNMANITPPHWARRITICADHDKPGLEAAGEALYQLRQVPHVENVRVVGTIAEGSDFADALAAGGWHAR